jgi:hypothetical protein
MARKSAAALAVVAGTIDGRRDLTDAPAGTDGDLSDEQEERFDELKGELAKLDRRIERQQLLDDADRRVAAPAIVSGRGDGAYEDRARESRVTRAIAAAIGEDVDAGLEREISAEVRRRTGRSHRGIACPSKIFEQRVLTIGSAAADLYPTQHLS